MTAVLHKSLPLFPWEDPRTARLPGIQPLQGDDWLCLDEAFAGQMALRDRLIAGAAPVHALLPEAEGAAAELYALCLQKLAGRSGYSIGPEIACRPDGVDVPLTPEAPLLTLGRLVQEDLCLLQPGPGGDYRLTGAILCFPASWTLAEKIGRPMTAIHLPVPQYNDDIARRVGRMFQAIRPEQPLWRMNHNLADSPDLFHPRKEADPRKRTHPQFVRAERQCLLRLPETQAIVFTIHTCLMRLSDLPRGPRNSLLAAHGAG